MPYSALKVSVPANFVAGSVKTAATWGDAPLGGSVSIPSLSTVEFSFWDGDGELIGRADA